MNSHNHPLGRIMTPSTTELLEDWPRRITRDCWDVDAKARCNTLSHHHYPPRVVTFSKLSSVQIYHRNPMDMRELSYTKDERKQFCTEAVAECLRIRQLLHSTPGGFNKDSFKCLIKNNVISLEDIVGIDHMVLGKSASLIKERQELIRSVVSAQYDIAMKGGDSTEKLAEFCASQSSRAVKRARVRAALSCPRRVKGTTAATSSDSSSEEEENDDTTTLTETLTYTVMQDREQSHDVEMKSPPRDSTNSVVDNKKLIVTSSPLMASPARSRRSSAASSNRARVHAALAAWRSSRRINVSCLHLFGSVHLWWRVV